MLETKWVGDKFEMLVIDSGCFWPIWHIGKITNITKQVADIMILPPASQISHHHKVTNIAMSPTSLSPSCLVGKIMTKRRFSWNLLWTFCPCFVACYLFQKHYFSFELFVFFFYQSIELCQQSFIFISDSKKELLRCWWRILQTKSVGDNLGWPTQWNMSPA